MANQFNLNVKPFCHFRNAFQCFAIMQCMQKYPCMSMKWGRMSCGPPIASNTKANAMHIHDSRSLPTPSSSLWRWILLSSSIQAAIRWCLKCISYRRRHDVIPWAFTCINITATNLRYVHIYIILTHGLPLKFASGKYAFTLFSYPINSFCINIIRIYIYISYSYIIKYYTYTYNMA